MEAFFGYVKVAGCGDKQRAYLQGCVSGVDVADRCGKFEASGVQFEGGGIWAMHVQTPIGLSVVGSHQ